jgi:hypothetical protein
MTATGPLKAFVIPGKNLASAYLHVARTQARQLERILVAMDRTVPLRESLKSYINRLSDALFAMARVAECQPEENLILMSMLELVTSISNCFSLRHRVVRPIFSNRDISCTRPLVTLAA